MNEYLDLLALPFMQRALLAAVFTGLAAPAVGTYLVQRRMALMGDGIGHVAVTGVAVGLLTGLSPTWTAIVVCAVGAVLIPPLRRFRAVPASLAGSHNRGIASNPREIVPLGRLRQPVWKFKSNRERG